MYYADPDEFLRKENIYSADPKESEPAADDSNQMEDHPEDHIPTYADPRTIVYVQEASNGHNGGS